MHSVVCIVYVERYVQTIHIPVDTPASEVFSRPSTQMWSTPLWAYFECGGTWGFNSERELCIRDFYGVRSVVEMWKNG